VSLAHAGGFVSRHRAPLLALLASVAVHASVMVGLPGRMAALQVGTAPAYEVSLVTAAALVPAPAPVPVPRSARPRPRAPAVVAHDTLAALPTEPSNDALGDLAPSLQAAPDVVAFAQPAVPVKVLQAAAFPAEALPPSLAIEYQLTSAFAEGRATYRWEREGDSYRIRGEAQAEGFFTLFLEGRILQESRGTVGPAGLRPGRFSEQKPNAAEEGLTFDWAAGTLTFERKGESRTGPLTGNTVDWLSMIFQLAHMPPASGMQELQVFTQRRMYSFRLQVLGIEEIDIPLGRVRALHLRHEDPARAEAVDVWLGVEQHYLPVKMRYPVARNRLVVEQVATRVESGAR
jgi:hypothetical protein